MLVIIYIYIYIYILYIYIYIYIFTKIHSKQGEIRHHRAKGHDDMAITYI